MYFILRPQINDFEYKECVGSTFYFPSIKALKNKIKIPEFVTLKKYVSGHLESFKSLRWDFFLYKNCNKAGVTYVALFLKASLKVLSNFKFKVLILYFGFYKILLQINKNTFIYILNIQYCYKSILYLFVSPLCFAFYQDHELEGASCLKV